MNNPLINKWRYLEDDYCTASLGLATDEHLARSLSLQTPSRAITGPSPVIARGEAPKPCPERSEGTNFGIGFASSSARNFGFASLAMTPRPGGAIAPPYSHALRLYTYGQRCALVGKYQEVSSEIDTGYCKTQGIAINRRPTGGGAIIMEKGQLGVAIALPLSEDFSLLKLSIVFERYSRGILLGLGRLGVRAEFKPRNDVLAGGKKIAGLAFASMGEAGLFHASLLVDLDEEFMEGALRIPPSKKASLTTVARELRREVSTGEIRQAVKGGYQEAFGIELVSEPLSQEEMRAIKDLEEARYKNPMWIFGQAGEASLVEKRSNSLFGQDEIASGLRPSQ